MAWYNQFKSKLTIDAPFRHNSIIFFSNTFSHIYCTLEHLIEHYKGMLLWVNNISEDVS